MKASKLLAVALLLSPEIIRMMSILRFAGLPCDPDDAHAYLRALQTPAPVRIEYSPTRESAC